MVLRFTLNYLEIPMKARTYLSGDNSTAVDSSMFSQPQLHKHHQKLYNWVMERISTEVGHLNCIPGTINLISTIFL